MGGAIVLEIAATAVLKGAVESSGLTRVVLVAVAVPLFVACYVSFARAMSHGIDLSVGYAVWCAVGIGAVTVLGVALFGERLSATKVVALVLIVVGVALLYLQPTHEAPSAHEAADRPVIAAAPADPVMTTGRSPQ